MVENTESIVEIKISFASGTDKIKLQRLRASDRTISRDAIKRFFFFT